MRNKTGIDFQRKEMLYKSKLAIIQTFITQNTNIVLNMKSSRWEIYNTVKLP